MTDDTGTRGLGRGEMRPMRPFLQENPQGNVSLLFLSGIQSYFIFFPWCVANSGVLSVSVVLDLPRCWYGEVDGSEWQGWTAGRPTNPTRDLWQHGFGSKWNPPSLALLASPAMHFLWYSKHVAYCSFMFLLSILLCRFRWSQLTASVACTFPWRFWLSM